MDKLLARIAAHFGLSAEINALGGECDLNFLAQDKQGPVIVKIMREGCDLRFVEMQIAAIAHALNKDPDLPLPAIIGEPTVWLEQKSRFLDRSICSNSRVLRNSCPKTASHFSGIALGSQGENRIIWLQRALSGRPMGDIAPQSLEFLTDLGRAAGRLNQALADFHHTLLERPNKWHLLQADWIESGFEKIKLPSRRLLLQKILRRYLQIFPSLQALPLQAIHNDLNDWNILVENKLNHPSVLSGLIDFGDMCRAPVICDLAIAGAYAIMRQRNGEQALAALVKGFHEMCPLSENELAMLWPLVRMRLAVSVVNAAIESEKTPGELYVTISERGAWDFLEDEYLDETRLLARLRHVCGMAVSTQAPAIATWLAEHHDQFAPVLKDDITAYPLADLSVETCLWPENPLEPRPLQSLAEIAIKTEHAIGRYGEPRLAYPCPLSADLLTAPERPTVSLGLDLFASAGSLIHAPLDGVVCAVVDKADGMKVILCHETPAGAFFTHWDHLASYNCKLTTGMKIKAGAAFAMIAKMQARDGWLPHCFVQMSFVNLSSSSWEYATSAGYQEFDREFFPNPAILLGLDAARVSFIPPSESILLGFRHSHFSANLKLSYRQPAMFVRGWRHYLFDQWGRPFLDAYNNVPHVGHAHPRIRKVACEQLARMNSNTRYLHPAQKAFAEKLISKMPENSGLEVCFFVNSGSEANELALRLARAATGGYDMITPDHGYHGNTTGAIDISAYKFNKPGMGGRKEWVHLVEVADDYRGRFRADHPDYGADCGTLYAAQIDEALAVIEKRGGQLAGFIAETFPSVGGQIIPPVGYLAQVYERIRSRGGICIADEVQTGLGRLGEYYFAFEQQGVIPDIVVLGKPIGNGYPLAALVTTREIAFKFAQGAEYFSTFGGSTLSCLMGREVMDIVDEEELAQNARLMGARLLSGLRQLQTRHQMIGEVRGMGLFIGVDLVEDRTSRQPATALAEHVTNCLRESHILIGREGPADNILKIRPPLTIDATSIDRICTALDTILCDLG